MIDYENLRKSLKHLELQHDNFTTMSADTPELMQQAVKESVIQRFETCYDCLWKTLKRYEIEELGLPDVPNSPKPLLRLVHENALFVSPIERWMQYADARIDTAHDYTGDKADWCLELVGGFIDDAVRLYERMTGETWS